MSKDIFKSLGIHVGEAPKLLNERKPDVNVSKGDLDAHVARAGARGNAREALDSQLSKGMAFGLPKMELKRVSPHAEDKEVDGAQKEREKEEDKADAKMRKQKRPEAETDGLKDTNAESFHSDNDKQVKDIQETVEEVDREFPRESRPAKKRGEWDYNRAEDGEKRYIYDMKSDSANAADFEGEMFLKGVGSKICKDATPPPPAPPTLGDTATSGGTSTINSAIGNPFGKAKKKKSLIEYSEDSNDPDLIANVHENYEGVNEKLRPAQLIMRSSKAFEKSKMKKKGALVEWAKEEEAEPEHKKKSQMDELADLVKSAPVTAAAPKVAPQASKSKVQFVKSAGIGGILFDFGHRTGNPIADQATDLLNSFADPVQAASAEYHRESFADAQMAYTKKGDAYNGEATPFGNVESGWRDQLNKPMDQQVKEAFDAGVFEKGGPAIKNEFNAVQAKVGGEVLKATSETDAAVLEMFKAEQEAMRSTEGGFVADASTGGKIKITAGE